MQTPTPPGQFTPATKRSLLVVSHAMERAFDRGAVGVPGLVVALFQRREYFDPEAARYGPLAEAGHTVIVGFVGSTAGLPEGVHAVAFTEQDTRARDWVLSIVRGPYVTSLIAHDTRNLAEGELTLEASRQFEARWTFRRQVALSDARTQLDRLAPDLPPHVLEAANAHIDASAAVAVSLVEDQLAAAADHLVTSVDAGQRRASRLRVELESTQSLAERDQLTGLNNRHFLHRYLGTDDRATDLLTLLVDVDNLKTVNDTHGHQAGDAVITAIATTLRLHSRPGDVVVRWGGDEFLILAPGVSAKKGLSFANRLVQAVRAARPTAPWNGLRLSVSVGVCPTHRTTIPIARLDQALYAVKQAGKGHAALAPRSDDEQTTTTKRPASRPAPRPRKS